MGYRCHIVESIAGGAGEMLAVFEHSYGDGMDLFKIDSARNVLESVRSIGNLPLFLGDRSLVVDADSFPAIEANCVYFQLPDSRHQPYIYKYNIGTFDEEEEVELVSAAMAKDPRVFHGNVRPYTIIQVLSNYTMDFRLPLVWTRLCQESCVEFDYYDECNYNDDLVDYDRDLYW